MGPPGRLHGAPAPGADATVLYRDLEATARSLDRQSQGDGRRWIEFAGPFLDAFAAVRATMLTGFPPIAGPLALLRRVGPRRFAGFTRLLTGSAVDLAERLFKGDGSRAWLYGAAMHGDTPPGKAGAGIAAFYLNLLGHGVGWPSPRGGAQRLTDALVAYLQSLGGEIRTPARTSRSFCPQAGKCAASG